MTLSLWDNLSTISNVLESAEHLLIGLDYDGTLTNIVDDPALVELSLSTTIALHSFSRRPDCTVAIVTGRALDDIQSRVSIEGVIYAGNHGGDISGLGLRYTESLTAAEIDGLNALRMTLDARLRHIRGVRIEDKGLTLSVHIRRVARSEVPVAIGIVEEAVSLCSGPRRLSWGKEAIEIYPNSQWHKGKAMIWICEQLGIPHSSAIYFGDDRTDEDVFEALHSGITVKVGDAANTSAQFYVDGPGDVLAFLCWVGLQDK